MTTTIARGGWRARPGLLGLLCLFAATAAPTAKAATMPTGPTADPAADRLILAYHGADPRLDARVAELLAAFAAEYGPDGLAVYAPAALSAHRHGVRRLPIADAHGSGAGSGRGLSLTTAGGELVLALPPDAIDLFPVYRECELRLRGGVRASYHDHVRTLLERHLAGDLVVVPAAADLLVPLSAVLAPGGAGALFLPPGCGACVLARFEAPVAAVLARDPALPVLAFETGALASLRAAGWTGAAYLLPLDAAARILELRQAGTYRPVQVRADGPASVVVAPLGAGREDS